MTAFGVLRERLPEKRAILNVYSVIVLFVYSWSLYASFWKVPSWIFSLGLGEIFSLYAYTFTVDLVESGLLLGACLALSLLLPARWWRDVFVARSLAFVIVFLGSIMLRLYLYGSPDNRESFVSGQEAWWVVTVILLAAGVWLAPKIAWWRKALDAFADRCSIFALFFLPISILAVIVVVARNILGSS